jgi:hypothetical protein
MPDCTYVSLPEALLTTHQKQQLRTIGLEYLAYIQRVPPGQAGRLSVAEGERVSAITVRRWLATVAKECNIPLTIKRSGQDVYFWREADEAGEQRR